jgi:hypothetical protein
MWVVGVFLRVVYAKVNGYESLQQLAKAKRSDAKGGTGKRE